MTAAAPSSFDQQDHLSVIDALRGYAILLVIAVHAVSRVAELPAAAQRLLGMGFYGVQLFFLASALTLMMSWRRSADGFGLRSAKFMLRRFFRIAPMYWLAVAFYWVAYPTPVEEFSLSLLFATLFFYNAWSPYLIPTVPGWTPVPGGWSIGVEFCFYLAFPLLAAWVTSLRRAVGFVIVTFAILVAASHFGQQLYPEISSMARINFLYFWPPNQWVIFALGMLLYHLIKDERVRQRVLASPVSADRATLILAGVLAAIAVVLGVNRLFDWERGLPPTHLLVSLCFVPWALVLVLKPSGRVIGSAIRGLGKVSFSAYVLHFAVLRYTAEALRAVWPFGERGVAAIAFWAILLVLTLILTRLVGELTYRYLEQPFITLGKRLTQRLGQRAAGPRLA